MSKLISQTVQLLWPEISINLTLKLQLDVIKFTVDQIFINIKDFYNPPTANPPFGLSDHVTVTVVPKVREKIEQARKTMKVHPKRQSDIASLGRFLLNIPWSDLLIRAGSCEEKLIFFNDVINYGLSTLMPERSVRIHETDKPWINANFKHLIRKRQKAFISGEVPQYRLLRKKVNRERKRCRKTYYNKKI